MFFKILNTALIRFLGVGLNFLITVIIAKELSASELGVYIMTITLVFGLSLFLRFGFNTIIIREIVPKEEPSVNSNGLTIYVSILLFSFSIAILASIVIVGLTYNEYINDWLTTNALTYTIVLSIPFVVAIQLSAASLLAVHKAKLAAFFEVLLVPLVLICLITLKSSNELSLTYIANSYVVASITCGFCCCGVAIKSNLTMNSATVDFSIVKQHLKAGGHYVLSDSAIFLITSLPLFVLSINQSSHNVGILGVLMRTVALVSLISVVINSLISPHISKLWKSKEYEEIIGIYKVAVAFFSLILFVAIPIVFFLAGYYLKFFGNDFVGNESYLIIMVICQLFSMALGPSVLVLSMAGKDKDVVTLSIYNLIVVTILSAILIPWLGLLGAVMTICLSTIFQKVFALKYLNKLFLKEKFLRSDINTSELIKFFR